MWWRADHHGRECLVYVREEPGRGLMWGSVGSSAPYDVVDDGRWLSPVLGHEEADALRARAEAAPRCVCGHAATCIGQYDGDGWSYGCDDCCGHGQEGGQCGPLSAAVRLLTEADARAEAVEAEVERLRHAAEYHVQATYTDRHTRSALQGRDRAIEAAQRLAAEPWSVGVEVVDPGGEVVAHFDGAGLRSESEGGDHV